MANSPGATWSASAPRWQELLPIIHFKIYDVYELEDKNRDLDRAALQGIVEGNKSLLVNTDNEQIFIDRCIKDYGENVLDTTQYKIA